MLEDSASCRKFNFKVISSKDLSKTSAGKRSRKLSAVTQHSTQSASSQSKLILLKDKAKSPTSLTLLNTQLIPRIRQKVAGTRSFLLSRFLPWCLIEELPKVLRQLRRTKSSKNPLWFHSLTTTSMSPWSTSRKKFQTRQTTFGWLLYYPSFLLKELINR